MSEIVAVIVVVLVLATVGVVFLYVWENLSKNSAVPGTQRNWQAGQIRILLRKADDKLLKFFARPGPRRAAQKALWLLTHAEQTFFLPFRLFIAPAVWLLEHHARRAQKTREKIRKGGGYS